MRNFGKTMEQVIAVCEDPGLHADLQRIYNESAYTAPESLWERDGRRANRAILEFFGERLKTFPPELETWEYDLLHAWNPHGPMSKMDRPGGPDPSARLPF